MSLTKEQIAEFMDEPKQRQCEVIVGHRLAYWMAGMPDVDDITAEMIEEADTYLEAHIRWRIAEALEEMAARVRAEWAPGKCPWVGALDDEASNHRTPLQEPTQ